jgi:hypothetical protein
MQQAFSNARPMPLFALKCRRSQTSHPGLRGIVETINAESERGGGFICWLIPLESAWPKSGAVPPDD